MNNVIMYNSNYNNTLWFLDGPRSRILRVFVQSWGCILMLIGVSNFKSREMFIVSKKLPASPTTNSAQKTMCVAWPLAIQGNK